MMRWVVGSILHGVDPLSYFSFQPELDDWCNKGCGMCYPVCGMVHIKEPLLLIGKSSPCLVGRKCQNYIKTFDTLLVVRCPRVIKRYRQFHKSSSQVAGTRVKA